MEILFKTIKTELIWRQTWPTRRQAGAAIFHYINEFYNARRHHSYLGGISTFLQKITAPGYDIDLGNVVLGIEGEISDSSVRAAASDILDDGDELNISAGRDIYAGFRLGAGVEFDFGQPFPRREYRFRQTPKLAPNQIFNSTVAVSFLDGRQDLLSRHVGPEHRLGIYLGPQQQNIGRQHQPQLEHHNRRQ